MSQKPCLEGIPEMDAQSHGEGAWKCSRDSQFPFLDQTVPGPLIEYSSTVMDRLPKSAGRPAFFSEPDAAPGHKNGTAKFLGQGWRIFLSVLLRLRSPSLKSIIFRLNATGRWGPVERRAPPGGCIFTCTFTTMGTWGS